MRNGVRLLLLAYYWPPAANPGAVRSVRLARHLPAQGILPLVLHAPPGVYFRRDPELLGDLPADVRTFRAWGRSIPLRFGLLAGPTFGPDAEWLWAWTARGVAARIVCATRPDAVLSSCYPFTSHLLARWLHRRFRLPWIAEFRDAWAGNFARPPRLTDLSDERRILDEANRVVFVTDETAALYRARHPDCAAKIRSVPNGYEPADFEGLAPVPPSERPAAVFAGTLYPSLVESARRFSEAWRSAGGASIVWIGSEWDPRGFPPEARFLPFLSHREALARQAAADVLPLFVDPRAPEMVPMKLYEYLRLGRPVAAVVPEPSAVARILRETGHPYRILPPSDPDVWGGLLAELRADAHHLPYPAPVSYSAAATAEGIARIVEEIAP